MRRKEHHERVKRRNDKIWLSLLRRFNKEKESKKNGDKNGWINECLGVELSDNSVK